LATRENKEHKRSFSQLCDVRALLRLFSVVAAHAALGSLMNTSRTILQRDRPARACERDSEVRCEPPERGLEAASSSLAIVTVKRPEGRAPMFSIF
jgi:hypothetical protein